MNVTLRITVSAFQKVNKEIKNIKKHKKNSDRIIFLKLQTRGFYSNSNIASLRLSSEKCLNLIDVLHQKILCIGHIIQQDIHIIQRRRIITHTDVVWCNIFWATSTTETWLLIKRHFRGQCLPHIIIGVRKIMIIISSFAKRKVWNLE